MASQNGLGIDALFTNLADLAGGEEQEHITALRERLAERRFRILVVGEAKRGKSTLVNALLGRVLLPTGVVPVTALPTVVRRGDWEEVTVRYLDGRAETRPMADLTDLVTEVRNPDNRLGVAEVVVHTPSQWLPDGVDLVDTPGVGSVFAVSSAAATAALDTMDAAVVVLTTDPPISGSERAFLSAVRARSVALFSVLNKVDNLDAAERAEVLEFTEGVLSAALGHPTKVYPVSARQALTDSTAATGLPVLRTDLTTYLAQHRSDALVASVAGHTGRIVARLLDEAVLTQRAAQLAAKQAGEQVDRFSERLAALDDYRRDAADVARASTGRLLADLNDAATWDAPRLTAELRDKVTAWLDAQPDQPASQLEDRARAYAVAQIRATADGWRVEWEQTIADRLAALDDRLATALDRQLAQVRTHAHDLLGIDLTLPVPAGRLLPEVGVSYAFGEDIGVTVLWEAALRRHLPGRLGRRAVRAHLLDEIDALASKQLGRIRSKFQDALRQATAVLIQAVQARYTDATAGLLAALTAAQHLADSPKASAALHELDTRITDLRRLAQALTDLAPPLPSPRLDLRQ